MTRTDAEAQIGIGKLLWLDDEFICDQALPDVLGDRYLNVTNSVYSQVRRMFLSNGFRYSSESTRMWRDYGSMPLLMLQEILDSGVVPYKDNAITLKRISERSPSLELPVDQLLALLGHNYLLHESAHCISYRLLSSLFGRSGALLADKDLYVFTCILCEAFATLLERVAAAQATSEVHRLFFTINSFVDCRDDVCSLLRDSIRIFGLNQTFVVGMLTLYYLNSHEENTNDQVAETIIEMAFSGRAVSDTARGFLRALINQGFGLHRKFRTETTPLFFRYVGCENEFRSLCGRPFDRDTIRAMAIMDAVAALSRPTCEDISLESPSGREYKSVLS